MPCSLHTAGTGVPAYACLRIAMIRLSEYFDFFMQNLLRVVYEKILHLTPASPWGDYRISR